jgi:hypothetical protein
MLIVDRAQVQLVPELRTVFLVVQNFDGDFALLGNGCANLCDRCPGGCLSLKEPAVFAQKVLSGVAGQIEKGIVRQHNRKIRFPCIGDDHRHPCALEGESIEFFTVNHSLFCRRGRIVAMNVGWLGTRQC